MADISKIKLPDNSTYDIAVYTDHVKPINTKTFTGVIGTAANWANATFFFGNVKPIDYNTHWKIRYRVYAQAAGDYRATATSDFTLNGINSAYTTYKAYNSIVNTSYRPVYYHVYYRATSTGITSYGHAMGLRLYSSWNAATAANARTFTIEILEVENCTFSFFDSMLKYENIPGTGSTNYAGYLEFDFANNGLQETGDVNDANYYHRNYYSSRIAAQAVYRYQFLLSKMDGSLIPFSTTDNSTGTSKTMNTTPFDPFGEIFWYYSSGTTATGNTFANSVLYDQYLSDWRYSFNIAQGGFTARKPVYIVATPQSDGTAVLSSPYVTQTLPNSADGFLYIYLGQVYEDSNTYRIYHSWYHPVFEYRDGGIKRRERNVDYVNSHTVNKDVPSDAKFTDTTYESKSAASGGTAVSLVTTGEKYTWNNKSTVPTNHAATGTTYGTGSSSNYGHVKLSDSTSSTSGTSGGIAATPSAVKTAYDLANQANTTANTAMSGLNGSYIYDQTFTIANGIATFTPHVYLKGAEVTSNYATSCFVWKYRLINGSEVTLTTKSDRGCDVTISNMGYGGHVIGAFTPPA